MNSEGLVFDLDILSKCPKIICKELPCYIKCNIFPGTSIYARTVIAGIM